VLPHSVI